MMNSFAFNIPFVSIFLLMLAAIVTPLLPKRNRLPEKLSCCVVGLVAILSAWL